MCLHKNRTKLGVGLWRTNAILIDAKRQAYKDTKLFSSFLFSLLQPWVVCMGLFLLYTNTSYKLLIVLPSSSAQGHLWADGYLRSAYPNPPGPERKQSSFLAYICSFKEKLQICNNLVRLLTYYCMISGKRNCWTYGFCIIRSNKWLEYNIMGYSDIF